MTKRYRTTGHPVPVFPPEVRSPRPSPEGGKYPLALAPTRLQGAVRPLRVDTRTESGVRPLVLLVDFATRQASPVADNVAIAALFYGPDALSLKAYWEEVSSGSSAVKKFTVLGSGADINAGVVTTASGWMRAGSTFTTGVTSPSDIAGVNPPKVSELIVDAIKFLDSQAIPVDLSPFVGPDNTFQAVILVQPGYGQEDSGNATDTYSHSAAIQLTTPYVTRQGFRLRDYTVVPALQFYNDPSDNHNGGVWTPSADDKRIGAGVIAHEMGHLLGLPDLYPSIGFGVVEPLYSGVGVFDLMGFGFWGNVTVASKNPGTGVPPPGDVPGAENPAHLSAWSKFFLGWSSQVVLPSSVTSTTGARSATGVSVPPAETDNTVYKLYPNGPGDESQYFLLENRRNDPYNSTTFPARFDKGLPGSGVLIWRVDAERMASLLPTGAVNDNSTYPSLAVMEADLSDGSPTPHLFSPFSIGLLAFGAAGDFYPPGLEFSRTRPVSPSGDTPRTNSAPIINPSSVSHVYDAGFFTTVRNFIASALDFLFDLFIDLPYWVDFNRSNSPIGTNRVLSYGFDTAGRTWIGTADQGVWIYALTSWKRITGFRSPRVQAMQFEPRTGSMWVGTDNSVEKVRLEAVQASFPPLPSVINVKGIQIARDLTKWVGGGRVLAFITDDGTNQASGLVYNVFPIQLAAGEEITCLAFDNVNSAVPADDTLLVGTSLGNIYRNTFNLYNFNTLTATFDSLFGTSPPANRPGAVYSLALDSVGILWVGSDKGVFAVDRDPGGTTLFNPFDLAGDNVLTALQYFPSSFTLGGTNALGPRGVAFQKIGMPDVGNRKAREIVWVAWGDNSSTTTSSAGGAERIDPNVLTNPALSGNPSRVALSLMKFPKPAVTELPGSGPVVSDLISAGSDGSNVWFGTNDDGAVRFGSGSNLTLDRDVYINESATAVIRLVDENAVGPTLQVTVTSTSDGTGFPMDVTLGADNVYGGTFGFTTSGSSDNTARKIAVKNGDTVTVTYRDKNPPSRLTRTAIWKAEVPFEDGLIIKPLCFITTAAYGSAMAPEVRVFRAFRDRVLLSVPGGEGLVGLYYRLSPPLAAWIAERPERRFLARCVLVPPLMAAEWAVGTGPGEKAGTILVILSVFLFVSRWRAGGKGHRPGKPRVG